MMGAMLTMLRKHFLPKLTLGRMVVWLKMMSLWLVLLVQGCIPNTLRSFGCAELWTLGQGWFSGCKWFCSDLGPVQTVQRAEMWGVVLALQARASVHIGDSNPHVVRHVGRFLGGLDEHRPFLFHQRRRLAPPDQGHVGAKCFAFHSHH